MMLKMNAVRWIFPLAMCLLYVSLSVSVLDEQLYEEICNEYQDPEIHTVLVLRSSSVLLPCTFESNKFSSVSWVHTAEGKLVELTSKGRVKFLLPRSGRVKAFPNQHSQGNYSIYIDELEDSDLGSYICVWDDGCRQVELVYAAVQAGTLVYICVGVAVLVLLSVSGCLLYYNQKQDNNNKSVGADIEGASAPPAEIDRTPVQEQMGDADSNNLVYENDPHDPAHQQGDPTRSQYILPEAPPHDPNWTEPTQSTGRMYPDLRPSNFGGVENQRTKQRFHRELLNRLRPASFSRHYYVNQHELRQQAMSAQVENQRGAGARKKEGKRRAKDNREYNNPIYNRSTDELNRL